MKAAVLSSGFLVETLWWSHGGLDVKRADVLPVFLEQRDEEVDGQMNVLCELIWMHVDVTDRDRQAQDFLHLELDGGLDLVDLLRHGLGVSQETGELTGLVEARAEQSGDLLDERLRGEEGVVLLGQLLHQLLVLVELLQRLGIHEGHVVGLGLVAVLLVAQNAHLHLRPWDVLQSACERNGRNDENEKRNEAREETAIEGRAAGDSPTSGWELD